MGQGAHAKSRRSWISITPRLTTNRFQMQQVRFEKFGYPRTHDPSSRSRTRIRRAATNIRPRSSMAATSRRQHTSGVVLQQRCQRPESPSALRSGGALPFSKSRHLFIVILLLSNSPSYSWLSFLSSPAVLRVSPQLKSSNFQ